MAQRRMISKKIIDTDVFLDMPVSARELYFQFILRADDEGFVGNPKRIIRMVGSSDDDLKMLFAKSFIIPFKSGVCVISHWKIHNYIQKDRFQKTQYIEEKKRLALTDSGKYKRTDGKCIQNVSKMDTQVSKGKVSKGKSSSRSNNINYNFYKKEYNKIAKKTPLPVIRRINDSRKEKIRKRLKKNENFKDDFIEVLKKIKNNNFLNGRKPGKSHPNWKADFDWIIANESNYDKILEDKYKKSEYIKDKEVNEKLRKMGISHE